MVRSEISSKLGFVSVVIELSTLPKNTAKRSVKQIGKPHAIAHAHAHMHAHNMTCQMELRA